MKKVTEKAEKMVEEITSKRKLDVEAKHKLLKKILINIGIAILMISLFCGVNLLANYFSLGVAALIIKAIAIGSILIDVVLFEVAYRKDSGTLGIIAIEWLITSCIVLCMPQVYSHIDSLISQICVLIPVFFAIYYILKCIFIYIKTVKQYQNNLSDVKEIVKEEEI